MGSFMKLHKLEKLDISTLESIRDALRRGDESLVIHTDTDRLGEFTINGPGSGLPASMCVSAEEVEEIIERKGPKQVITFQQTQPEKRPASIARSRTTRNPLFQRRRLRVWLVVAVVFVLATLVVFKYKRDQRVKHDRADRVFCGMARKYDSVDQWTKYQAYFPNGVCAGEATRRAAALKEEQRRAELERRRQAEVERRRIEEERRRRQILARGVIKNGRLMWQANPTPHKMKWRSAKRYCSNLTLHGYHDWRLPSISELRTIIQGCPQTQTGGACRGADNCRGFSCWSRDCGGCSNDRGPANGCYWLNDLIGKCAGFWSSSSQADSVYSAWRVNFNNGYVGRGDKIFDFYVRCVRGGP